MKKYIITISIAVLAVIGIGVGLAVKLNKPRVIQETPGAYPHTFYVHHIQMDLDALGLKPWPKYTHSVYIPSEATEAEKHYQDLLDAGHQDVDNDNQLKYNY